MLTHGPRPRRQLRPTVAASSRVLLHPALRLLAVRRGVLGARKFIAWPVVPSVNDEALPPLRIDLETRSSRALWRAARLRRCRRPPSARPGRPHAGRGNHLAGPRSDYDTQAGSRTSAAPSPSAASAAASAASSTAPATTIVVRRFAAAEPTSAACRARSLEARPRRRLGRTPEEGKEGKEGQEGREGHEGLPKGRTPPRSPRGQGNGQNVARPRGGRALDDRGRALTGGVGLARPGRLRAPAPSASLGADGRTDAAWRPRLRAPACSRARAR